MKSHQHCAGNRGRGVFAGTMLGAALGCFGSPARGQQDCLSWVDRSDVNNANGPPGTGNGVTAPAAYDSRRGVTVLLHVRGDGFPSQTWEFNGQFWTHKSVATAPGQSGFYGGRRAAMVYDSRRFVCVVNDFGDVWEWDGESWTLRDDAPFPPGLIYNYDWVYDSARGVTVLYGGHIGVAPSDQTWEFDGATWVQRHPTTHPPAMESHRMAYDSTRAVVVLLSTNGVDLWEYDGDEWVQRTSLLPPSPAARNNFAMGFDDARGVTVMQGGDDANPGSLSDTWEWDGVNWTQRLPGNPGGALINRARHVLVFDSARKQSMILGGEGVSQTLFLAELAAPSAPTPLGIPLSVTAVEGEPAQFFVTATGGNPLTVQWRHNSVPIPGATQQTLSFVSVTAADQGVYDAILGSGEYVPFTCPTSVSNSGILTVLPAVPGDIDHDGDFDLEDVYLLLPGFTGPGQ